MSENTPYRPPDSDKPLKTEYHAEKRGDLWHMLPNNPDLPTGHTKLIPTKHVEGYKVGEMLMEAFGEKPSQGENTAGSNTTVESVQPKTEPSQPTVPIQPTEGK